VAVIKVKSQHCFAASPGFLYDLLIGRSGETRIAYMTRSVASF
jgi:hypothetical protein